MSVRTILAPYMGLTHPVSRRPHRLNFTGLNTESVQAQNLVFCAPMWEPPGCFAMDLGPYAMDGEPIGTILQAYDHEFGDVYFGDGAGSGGTTPASRGYKFPNHDAINFGASTNPAGGSGRPFSMSFWFKPTIASPSVDVYLMTFDDPGQTNFPGYAVSWDTGGILAINTGNVTIGDAGYKTDPGALAVNQWNHVGFTHFPQGTDIAGVAASAYYVNGRLHSTNNSVGKAVANVGAVGKTVPMYFGVDDDGLTQPYAGWFFDLRLYNGLLTEDIFGQMFHPETRWELFNA